MYYQYEYNLRRKSTSVSNRYHARIVPMPREQALEQCDRLRAMINTIR